MSKVKEKALTAKAILGADDLVSERVDVPEWGGHVLVRTMTAGEKDRFQMATLTQRKGEIQSDIKKMRFFRCRAVALTIINEKGERLFDLKQVELLGEKSALALDRVYAVTARLNGLSQDAAEELEGNLEPSPEDDSSSD